MADGIVKSQGHAAGELGALGLEVAGGDLAALLLDVPGGRGQQDDVRRPEVVPVGEVGWWP